MYRRCDLSAIHNKAHTPTRTPTPSPPPRGSHHQRAPNRTAARHVHHRHFFSVKISGQQHELKRIFLHRFSSFFPPTNPLDGVCLNRTMSSASEQCHVQSYPEASFNEVRAQIRKLQQEKDLTDLIEPLGTGTSRIIERIAKELDAIHKTTLQKSSSNQHSRSGGASRNRASRSGEHSSNRRGKANASHGGGSGTSRGESGLGSGAPPVTAKNIRLAPGGAFGQRRSMRDGASRTETIAGRGRDDRGASTDRYHRAPPSGSDYNARGGGRGSGGGRNANNTPKSKLRRFRKEFNIIMNSLTGKNTADIQVRLVALVSDALQEALEDSTTTPHDTDSGVHSEGCPTADSQSPTNALMEHISTLFVECASIQAIYSDAYATILKGLNQKVRWPEACGEKAHVRGDDDGGDSSSTKSRTLVGRVCQQVTGIEPGAISKLNAKGYARFATHLHRQDLLSRDMLEAYVLRWANMLASGACGDNLMAVCELLVQVCLTLAEVPALKLMWTTLIEDHIAPMWLDGSTVNMRAKIRLWDVRDAYLE